MALLVAFRSDPWTPRRWCRDKPLILPLAATTNSPSMSRPRYYESCAYGVTRKKSRAILFDREANQFA